MKIGTKSLLFGCHQFLIHPLFVFAAWCKLYGFPWDIRIWVAIFVHDIGYWGRNDIDGDDGKLHPWNGAILMDKFGPEWGDLCIKHSGSYCSLIGEAPGKLYYADKLAFCMEPWWLYAPRVYATGEIREFRANSAKYDASTISMSNHQWFDWLKNKTLEKVNGARAWNNHS